MYIAGLGFLATYWKQAFFFPFKSNPRVYMHTIDCNFLPFASYFYLISDCGDPHIKLTEDDACYNLSYPVTDLSADGSPCFWEVWAPDGYRVYVEVLPVANFSFFLRFSANGSFASIFFNERNSDVFDVVSPGSHLNINLLLLGGPGVEFLLKITITDKRGKTV